MEYDKLESRTCLFAHRWEVPNPCKSVPTICPAHLRAIFGLEESGLYLKASTEFPVNTILIPSHEALDQIFRTWEAGLMYANSGCQLSAPFQSYMRAIKRSSYKEVRLTDLFAFIYYTFSNERLPSMYNLATYESSQIYQQPKKEPRLKPTRSEWRSGLGLVTTQIVCKGEYI